MHPGIFTSMAKSMHNRLHAWHTSESLCDCMAMQLVSRDWTAGILIQVKGEQGDHLWSWLLRDGLWINREKAIRITPFHFMFGVEKKIKVTVLEAHQL